MTGAADSRRPARPSGAVSTPAQMFAIVIFVAATLGALQAEALNLPLTAAIVYLGGVTLVGGLSGIRGGLLGAFAASLVYNFFISVPHFRFSLDSAEEAVPLIGFALSAVASALLAGRLRERALTAEKDNLQRTALFDLSQRLQSAVQVQQIPLAVEPFAGTVGRTAPELYVVKDGGELVGFDGDRGIELARELVASGTGRLQHGQDSALLLATRTGPDGVLVLREEGEEASSHGGPDFEAFLNVITIAFERCLLLEQAAEAEVIKRSEAFKTDLLSSVSHDLRSPLSAISASASSLERYGAELTDEVRGDLLATIREQCDRLNRYTTNLLDLGRLQGGVDPRRFMECDALEVLGIAISRTRRVAGGRGLTKSYDVDSALVRADPVMLEQVYYNVLENAVHYSPEGSTIAVAATVEDDRLLVDVVDQGPGISAGDEERVFTRFYRAHLPSSHDGSGLGLSIAKGFTEAFGGSIAAQRIDDTRGGTRVRVGLPLETRRGA